MISNSIIYIVLAASILALAFAFIFYKQMMKQDEGTDLMKKIAAHVRKGAMAYLKQQYKVVIIVFIILAAIFRYHGLLQVAERRRVVCLPHGRFLLGLGRFLRNEDGHIRLGAYGQCRS